MMWSSRAHTLAKYNNLSDINLLTTIRNTPVASMKQLMSRQLRFEFSLLASTLALAFAGANGSSSSGAEPAVPVFKDGEAQVVKAFEDPDYWIRHDLWVETEFDSDDDGKPDRMHVSVTRPRQTESEGLKLPVVYVSSPYFAGTGAKGREYFWDPRQELGETPPERKHFPAVERKGLRPIISKSHVKEWVPRGYIVVHSSSPGTGLSQGCPTVGGDNESLAPKAVIDWLCGRADGFTTPDGDERVVADWCTGKVGMTGTSYNGTIPLAAATTGVEGLEAIIPIAPNTSYYHYYRSNGLIRHPFGFMGEDIDYLYDFIHSGNEARCEYCDSNVRDEEMADGFDRVTGDYNDFWAGRDYLNDLRAVEGRCVDGARLQRLERRSRTQRSHLSSAQGERCSPASLLSSRRTRRTATDEADESLVHALSCTASKMTSKRIRVPGSFAKTTNETNRLLTMTTQIQPPSRSSSI